MPADNAQGTIRISLKANEGRHVRMLVRNLATFRYKNKKEMIEMNLKSLNPSTALSLVGLERCHGHLCSMNSLRRHRDIRDYFDLRHDMF